MEVLERLCLFLGDVVELRVGVERILDILRLVHPACDVQRFPPDISTLTGETSLVSSKLVDVQFFLEFVESAWRDGYLLALRVAR
jgi:hypothetical protein